ncbi:MAG: hypothetical protein ACM31C_32275 [Acidobacteriota bacterium]
MTRWLAVALAACSSHAKPAGDGPHVAPHVVEPARASDAAPAPPTPTGPPGDLQVRVEWHDVPVALRSSPGRTPCGTAEAPSVAPTTTWGIPDVFVILSSERAKPAPDPGARVTLEHCAFTPRVAIAGGALAIASAELAPREISFAQRTTLDKLDGVPAGTARPVQLPIAGHEVAATLEAGGVYEVVSGASDAWIVAAGSRYAGVTDAAGQVVLRDLPSGTYAVTAWLPPRGGQPGKLAHGEAKVTAGALAQVTVDLAPR